MQRARLNLLLAVIVAALGVTAYVAKRHKDQPKGKLTDIAAEGVDRILVEWPGSPAIRLEKQAGEWMLTAPVKARADQLEAVGATGVASTEIAATVEGGDIDAKELGFEPPDHTVTFNDVKVEFGGSDALQSRRYVRVGGAVKLIEDPATAALDKDYADLVAKTLFDAKDPPVKIELPLVTITKGADGVWTAPSGTANASPAALKTLAEGWQNAQAMWNEAAPGETPPKGLDVRVTLQSGAVQRYVVAATDPQFALYAPALKVTHQLSKALADELLKLPEPPASPAPDAAPKS